MKIVQKSRFWFCPCKDPETESRCNKLLSLEDDTYIDSYGMCKDCFEKYNKTDETSAKETT